ncbi:hypothetical protein GA0115255_118442 [Streptomyces sp. Ncost-T6T-2b]|nr:hypothetical protein GA0115255_118442 [Streptomyces sp. Ncost-T6T-2b]
MVAGQVADGGGVRSFDPPAARGLQADLRPAVSSRARSLSGSGDRTSVCARELVSMKSRMVVSARSRPCPITTMWSAVSSISLMRWLERKTVRPSAASDRISPRIQRMPSVSRPLTGSSRISTSGSPISAAAIPSRWPMPSEKPLVRRRAVSSGSPTRSRTSPTRRRGMPLLAASPARWW